MHIEHYRVILWDFDGVIKDSLNVKTAAFTKLFEQYGPEVAERVRNHHINNGGMSRYEKFPLYASWIGRDLDEANIQDYSRLFSELALQGVIDSPWVPGVEAYLRDNKHDQIFAVVSATPQEELELILQKVALDSCFHWVYGSPKSKDRAIAEIIERFAISPNECLMIGDARADQEAAVLNGVDFLLRRHNSNAAIFESYVGPSVKDFIGL